MGNLPPLSRELLRFSSQPNLGAPSHQPHLSMEVQPQLCHLDRSGETCGLTVRGPAAFTRFHGVSSEAHVGNLPPPSRGLFKFSSPTEPGCAIPPATSFHGSSTPTLSSRPQRSAVERPAVAQASAKIRAVAFRSLPCCSPSSSIEHWSALNVYRARDALALSPTTIAKAAGDGVTSSGPDLRDPTVRGKICSRLCGETKVPQGRLKVAQDAVLGKLIQNDAVPKGRLIIPQDEILGRVRP
jgi:hypothetical protein